MIIVFAFVSLCLAYKQRWIYLYWASVSQAPFWSGSAIYFWTGNPAPSIYNLWFNLFVAAYLCNDALKRQERGQKSAAPTWISVLFCIMATLDILHFLPLLNTFLYFALQESGHYLALFVCGYGYYVFFDSTDRSGLHPLDPKTDRDLA